MNDAISSISSGSGHHADAKPYNPSDEDMGKDRLTANIKWWVVLPIMVFHFIGLIVIVVLILHFLDHPSKVTEWTWPALLAAITGMPFGFSTNVKRLIDVVIFR